MSYISESVTGGNYSIKSDSLQPSNMLNDELFNSAGLYSKEDIEKARFHKYSRFGRLLDPYGRVNPGREFLFFVKPDLHICLAANDKSNPIYDSSVIGAQYDMTDLYQNNNMFLNPQLNKNSYFKNLLDTNPDVINELQYSIKGDDPFCHLLSSAVSSSLNVDDSSAKTIDNASNLFGVTYNYLSGSEASDDAISFSLEFVDDKKLDVYHFFRGYSEYHIERRAGLVTPPLMDYYRYRRLHNTMGIYKFIVAEDNETLLYWAYLCGVIPTSCPRGAFADPEFSNGLTFSVSFEAAFMEDMNPVILHQFNKLMYPIFERYNGDKDKWLTVVKQNSAPDDSHSYDTDIGYGANTEKINGITYNFSAVDRVDGTLPVAALIDGRQIKSESPKFRLRWYADTKTEATQTAGVAVSTTTS